MESQILPLLFNLLLSFYPLLKVLGSNPAELQEGFSVELLRLILFFGTVFLIQYSLNVITRSKRINVVYHAGVFLSFFWSVYANILGYFDFVGLLVFLIGWASLLVLIWKLSANPKIESIMVQCLLVVAVIPILQGYYLFWKNQTALESSRKDATQFTAEITQTGQKIKNKPNIYLLIFDTMSSLDYYTGHVNRSEHARKSVETFRDQMKGLGYKELSPSWSNYGRTYPSMPSFFNMEYLAPQAQPWPMESSYFGILGTKLPKIFQSAGYRLVTYEGKSGCPAGVDSCFNTVHNPGIASAILSATPILSILQKLDKHFFIPRKSLLLAELTASLSTVKVSEVTYFMRHLLTKESTQRPELTFVRFEGPHPVNYFDENCETRSATLFQESPGEVLNPVFTRWRYASEYLCFLKKMRELAYMIRKLDPNAWVLLFSDHGVGVQEYGSVSAHDWDKKRIEATFQVLAYAKAPSDCIARLEKAVTHVNKARALVNCVIGEDYLSYQPDRAEAVNFAQPGEFPIGKDGNLQNKFTKSGKEGTFKR